MNAYNTQEAARSFVVKDIRGVELEAGATTEVDLLDIPAGASVGLVKAQLLEPFGGETGTITALGVEIGDDDDPNGFIESFEVLGSASEVDHSQSDGAYATIADSGSDDVVVPGSFKLYSAAKKLKVLFTKTGAGSATARFTEGRLRLVVEIVS